MEGNEGFEPFKISRPDDKLRTYYFLVSLTIGPLFPLIFVPLWLKFRSMQYSLDENGISMSWGILFRNEIHLTYRRIQDIHLTRNIFQRWMGLSTLEIQTASGSSSAEMVIEGILETEELRDFLYSRMEGSIEEEKEPGKEPDETLIVLREIRDLLQELNEEGAHES
ncbi:PH domain-containing protein [Candidatus Riflebacteria bacterium]